LIEIIPAEGLGRFGLTPSQLAPRNAYVALNDVQEALDVPKKINSIFLADAPKSKAAIEGELAPLSYLLSAQLTDYGLVLKHVKMTFGNGDSAQTIYDYFSFSSERLLIEPAAERVITTALKGDRAQPLLTYLANNIEKVGASDRGQESGGIPY